MLVGFVLAKDKNMTTVFDRATETPCPICLNLAESGQIRRETVMPLPQFGPVNRDNQKCCFDCQSAENLVKYGMVPTFLHARIAVGNERQETLRMPIGMAELMGMCSRGLVRSANETQLDHHQEWLDAVFPLVIEDAS